ncbi:PilT/PilU family type 4a pilus ATPase [Microbacterium sp. zg.Y1090]|uniref:type IV pilus twitching motility protein PilT n=1 Tax=Microbacterium wangruii TaxID=3049073 RepID=UPI00214D8821|nr:MULTISPECIES: PilT/PilU family type 4a pilus ATPase [unclassified Microbacterium]MCR2819899.1 PilT/PilU family type 4a pilus ATPase [Microbacterium sp. zg.Y1090]WIM27487.1 PilT/PilU family type 4a pilus ATPase [Microbacterium sp. zg-Y1090]
MVADEDGVMRMTSSSRFDALMRGDEVDPALRSFLTGVPGVTLPGADASPPEPEPVAQPTTSWPFEEPAVPAAPTVPVSTAPTMPMSPAPVSYPAAASQEPLPPAPVIPSPTVPTMSFFDPEPVASRLGGRSAASQAPAEPESRRDEVAEVLRAHNPEVDPEFISSVASVLDLGASDLHLVAESTPVVRVDGELKSVAETTVWDKDRVRRVIDGLVTAEQMEAFERDLELDLAYSVGDIARFRVNIFQDQRGLGAALRIIPTQIKSVVQLGLPPELVDLARLPRGLVLVCGPTGSGKSTTLAAIIDKANSSRAAHIVTVEDPIEFLHHHKRGIINQREVGADTHSFSEALKHSLRQDPDIILVGEMRDLETISTALTAAETGHLVFATLHTQDAGQTIDRIIDVYPAHQQAQVRTQLAATLRAVVVQTLIRRSGGRGRAVATEVMFSTPAIQALIRAGKTHQMRTAIQAGNSIGMHTLDQDLARLVLSGQIEHSQALELAQDETEFEQLVRNRGLARTPADAEVPEGTRQVAGGA